MILNNNVVKIDSNIQPNQSLNFGISDVRLVVDILSKLYAYPIRTLVQEYICNGRDAMREAGTWGKLPIEITVPTTLEPSFKVRDFGVGISPDRMENIFVNYGSSTKRNTNTQTGGFGIGAKSAFSYTDSFTVTSFVNGVKYIYVAHLGEQGGVNLISKANTSEKNGVEISIGVKPKDITVFYEAVQRCVRFWTEPIRFIGTKNISQLTPVLTLDNMTIYDSRGEDSRTIFLIDGIEYDLMEGDSGKYWKQKLIALDNGNSIVALNVNNGVFKIASSRERLESNDTNKSIQDKMLFKCNNTINDLINQKVNNRSLTLEDRIKNKTKYSYLKLVNNIDIDLGNGFKLGSDAVSCPKTVYFRHVRRGRRGSTHYEINNTTRLPLDIVVFETKEDNSQTARRLNFYLESNNKKLLVNINQIKDLPHQDILFKNRINADDLPLPPKKTSGLARKSARDSICWSVRTDGSKTQRSIENLNTSVHPVIIVDEVCDDSKNLSLFIDVVVIPKCNKDLVIKKGMTIEQGKKYLLSKNKQDVLGIDELPHNWEKVKVLKNFKRRKSPEDIRNYLLEEFPDLKTQIDQMRKEYKDIVKKYPLITVLGALRDYNTDARQIVINEINKQTEGN